MKRRIQLLVILSWLAVPSLVPAKAPSQATFGSAEEAARSLREALESDDPFKIRKLFGTAEGELASGDPVADQADRKKLARAMAESTRTVLFNPKFAMLYLGAEDWPFPVPLVQKGTRWMFDTEAGLNEVRMRRIGANELQTIETCREIIRAQHEYADRMRGQNAGSRVFAQRLVSSPGQKDGLYWESSAGEEESPLGPAVQGAMAEGYGRSEKPEPFHGYVFKILTSQGSAAPGGRKDYVVGGRMTEGVAVLAFPCKWGASGIMTFIVGSDGTVYQQNLGPRTESRAPAIVSFDPDKSWKQVPR